MTADDRAGQDYNIGSGFLLDKISTLFIDLQELHANQ
jgi:hypothetical protein